MADMFPEWVVELNNKCGDLEKENERLRNSNSEMLRTLHQIAAHQRIVGGSFAQHGTTYQLAAEAIDKAMVSVVETV